MLKKHLFDGVKKLEEFDKNEYLVWKQLGNLFVAVNRFNVVNYWSTLSGKLIHRARLEAKD